MRLARSDMNASVPPLSVRACSFALTTLLTCAALLVLPSTGHAATTVGSLGSWNGSQRILAFGEPETATYGEVVTAPAEENRLNSFKFYLKVPTKLKWPRSGGFISPYRRAAA